MLQVVEVIPYRNFKDRLRLMRKLEQKRVRVTVEKNILVVEWSEECEGL